MAKPVKLQVDASKSGVGAVLIQSDMPVTYASRSLTPAETRYAQIEKELLAVVCWVQSFLSVHLWQANHSGIRSSAAPSHYEKATG